MRLAISSFTLSYADMKDLEVISLGYIYTELSFVQSLPYLAMYYLTIPALRSPYILHYLMVQFVPSTKWPDLLIRIDRVSSGNGGGGVLDFST